ncbi:hypothetical protein TA5113_03340 [Cognatishimia activa]|nr:hypothetical protein TA5113_03340 [Cognatishimia activa]
MAREQSDGAAEPSLNDVVDEPCRPESATKQREQFLFFQMCGLIRAGIFGIPGFGRHPGGRNQLKDLVRRRVRPAIQNRHPRIDDVKRKILRATNFRSDDPVQDRDLFGAIQAADMETAAVRGSNVGWLNGLSSATTAARALRYGRMVLAVLSTVMWHGSSSDSLL